MAKTRQNNLRATRVTHGQWPGTQISPPLTLDTGQSGESWQRTDHKMSLSWSSLRIGGIETAPRIPCCPRILPLLRAGVQSLPRRSVHPPPSTSPSSSPATTSRSTGHCPCTAIDTHQPPDHHFHRT